MDFKKNFNNILNLFKSPTATFSAIKELNTLDVAQIIIYLVGALVVGIVTQGMGGFVQPITMGIGIFVGALIFWAIMLIAGGKIGYISVVNVVLYTGIITLIVNLFSKVPVLGGILSLGGLIYAIYLQIRATIIVAEAPPKRTYITFAVIIGVCIVLSILAIAIIGAAAFALIRG